MTKLPDFLADGYSDTWKFVDNKHYVNHKEYEADSPVEELKSVYSVSPYAIA